MSFSTFFPKRKEVYSNEYFVLKIKMLKELIGIPIYHKFKVSQRDFIQLQKYATSHLGVKDIYSLKDKFEGERYYNEFLQRSFAELAFQDYTNVSYFDISEKEMKNFKPEFNLKGTNIELVSCDFEEYPKIPVGDYDNLVICYVNISTRQVWIIGSIDRDVAIDNSDQSLVSPVYRKLSHGVFKKFTLLKDVFL